MTPTEELIKTLTVLLGGKKPLPKPKPGATV